MSDVTPALLRGWPLDDPATGKDARGHVLVLGGSCSTPGAVLLAGEKAPRGWANGKAAAFDAFDAKA